MKTPFLFSLLAFLLLAGSACDSSKKGGEQNNSQDSTTDSAALILENSLDQERKDEPVVLSRQKVASLFESIPEGKTLKISTPDGSVVPSQLDDLNGDGQWEELAMLVDIPPKAELELQLSWVPAGELPAFQDRAEVYFGVAENADTNYQPVESEIRPAEHEAGDYGRYQMEGPAWGNDIVAFRSYFDARNGKDIFGKRNPELHLSKTGLLNDKSSHSYHELQNWGMDILKVGNSLGAGALALMHNGQAQRLTGTEKAAWKQVCDGPVRAIMELKYEGWKVGESTLNLQDRITVWAGKPWYRSTVTLEGNDQNKNLVTGLVNKRTKEDYTELDIADQYAAIYTHDKQSENDDYLGLGLMVDQQKLVAFAEAPEKGKDGQVTNTYYAQLKYNEPVTYRFFVGWEMQDPQYKDPKAFENLLKAEGQKLASPLKAYQTQGSKKVAL